MTELPPSSGPISVSPPSVNTRRREMRLALVNSLKLGASMLVTWSIGLVGRLYVPRFLGPERFGILNFADAFCATAFVMLGLGLDTYVRREISVRPKHANDFMGGVLALRLTLLTLTYIGVELVMRGTHRSEETKQLVYIFGACQFFMADSAVTAGLLQAVGQINGQSVLSIIAKLAWGLCIFLAVFFDTGLWGFAMGATITEGVKAIALFFMARKELGFRLHVDFRATKLVLWASMPFFVSSLAATIYGRIGVSILAFLSNDAEVGWFGAASGLQGISLMLVPIVSWVLTPVFARAAVASESELFSIVRSSTSLIMTFAIPLALLMLVGADYWVTIAFGMKFAAAAQSLRVLAVATPLMYMSVLAAYTLAVMNLSWRMTMVYVGGIVVSPVTNLLLIRPLAGRLGPGGAGAACSVAVLVTEICITIPLCVILGRRCFDRELSAVLAKSTVAAAAVVLLDATVLQRFGPARVAIDMVLYVGAVFVTGALDVPGMLASLKAARSAKGSIPPSSVPPPPSVPPP